MHDKIVLTYANTRMTDGAGAQLQRIYGTYAVSRLVGAAYLHTPLARVEYQGVSALERNAVDPDYHRPFNELFRIPSDVAASGPFHDVELGNLEPEQLDALVAKFDSGATGGRPILAHLVVPFGIADRFPDCYEACKAISPFATPARDGRALRIALHVRRGELHVVDSHRMLPNAYYVAVGQRLAQALDAMGIAYSMELHTEIAGSEFAVPPGWPGILSGVAGAVISPAMSQLGDFDALPNLVRCINEPTIESLRKLATADVLVTSRSSFSYLAGILNKRGIVLCHPFWHSPLSSWLAVDSAGRFDRLKFSLAVAGLVGRERASRP